MAQDQEEKRGENPSVSRRGFLKGVGSGMVGSSALTGLSAIVEEARAAEEPVSYGPKAVSLQLRVNGQTHATQAEPRETLLEVLRDRLDITGPKLVCDKGTCGACTVLLDGRTALACMTLAIEAQGKEIVTIEGLANGDTLHPVQQAFIDEDAFQCGFCTPGMVLSTVATLRDNPQASREEIKEGLSGHLCRCGAYSQIFNAAERARDGKGK